MQEKHTTSPVCADGQVKRQALGAAKQIISHHAENLERYADFIAALVLDSKAEAHTETEQLYNRRIPEIPMPQLAGLSPNEIKRELYHKLATEHGHKAAEYRQAAAEIRRGE